MQYVAHTILCCTEQKNPCAPKAGLVRTRFGNPCAKPCAEPLCRTLCGILVQNLVRQYIFVDFFRPSPSLSSVNSKKRLVKCLVRALCERFRARLTLCGFVWFWMVLCGFVRRPCAPHGFLGMDGPCAASCFSDVPLHENPCESLCPSCV